MRYLFQNVRGIVVDYSALGAEITAISLMGGVASKTDIIRLSGAMRGSRVRVGMELTQVKKAGEIRNIHPISLTVENARYLKSPMVRHVYDAGANGYLSVIDNINFVLKDEWRGKGITARSLAHQIEAAKRLGFSHILANVVGRPGSEYSGWEDWPRMGYDGRIPDDIFARFPRQKLLGLALPVSGPLTVQQLLDAKGGGLWSEYGEGFQMEIDLQNLNQRVRSLVERFVESEQELEQPR